MLSKCCSNTREVSCRQYILYTYMHRTYKNYTETCMFICIIFFRYNYWFQNNKRNIMSTPPTKGTQISLLYIVIANYQIFRKHGRVMQSLGPALSAKRFTPPLGPVNQVDVYNYRDNYASWMWRQGLIIFSKIMLRVGSLWHIKVKSGNADSVGNRRVNVQRDRSM